MQQPFLVAEAIVSIFPLDDTGAPDTANPLWLGEYVTGLTFQDELVGVNDHATGERYGKIHHVDETHEISVERLWTVDATPTTPPEGDLGVQVLPSGGATLNNGNDYRLQPNQEYVMSIVWQDTENQNLWHWRVYYGVKDATMSLAGNASDDPMRAAHKWTAQFMVS